MVVKIGEFDLDTSNISPADVENLRKMLPVDLQQQGKLTQLEIILEAIHYIQMLQNKLKTKEKWRNMFAEICYELHQKILAVW